MIDVPDDLGELVRVIDGLNTPDGNSHAAASTQVSQLAQQAHPAAAVG